MDRQPGYHHSDNGRISGELLALDCNLASLCDHTQSEGSNHGSFSDVILKAVGARYHLRRLIHSRSLYFRLLIGYFPSMTKIVDTLVPKLRSVGVILRCLMAGMSGNFSVSLISLFIVLENHCYLESIHSMWFSFVFKVFETINFVICEQ
ncbi:hypothetical protein HanXRQr2_Chr11g0481281 [Helianthus annuus]|uniref:Uncharacterized protein n=1 Tax=Helianthus annuus TaxID=4232 RepID=A0A9K3MZB5_HELAN|nr:hypothetical protein HanXRQr2_Chr11g0481281 [Helianthus annuus]KAJ0508528.1 hypothetical protein HanIR_Chr11g0518211 [Helianthus annuus]KAJ0516777.1 hypothetical protein HanHA89_Chr11g0417581 [Helianthus annuus]KAJ0684779.1 hypothetical protein HanLR1_Chr11g0394971 [Helianthus annuus]